MAIESSRILVRCLVQSLSTILVLSRYDHLLQCRPPCVTQFVTLPADHSRRLAGLSKSLGKAEYFV